MSERGPVETLEWIKPRGLHDGGCNVYGCELPSSAVLRVGGGETRTDVGTTSIRFCWPHFQALRNRADNFARLPR